MCLGCLVTSAVLAFTPASLPPQTPYATQQKIAIATMVEQLPISPHTTDLRQGLLSLEEELAKTQNDQEARQLVRQRLSTLSDQVAVHPQSDRIFSTLDQMIANTESPPTSSGRSWGWLQ